MERTKTMTFYKSYQTKNKFSAIKTMVLGRKFDSKKEAGYALFLESELQKKNIKSWESHKKFELFGVNGTKVCSYIADFEVIHNDGTIEILDVKSKATVTSMFRLKFKLLADKYKDEIKRGEVKLTVQY